MNEALPAFDAHGPDDRAIVHDRTGEIDALYTAVFQTRLLLVYGAAGSGKTSIIQTGLAARFKETDWFPVTVRRQEDINAAFDREIRRMARTPIRAGVGIVRAINSLYLDFLRPITIIFDPFEELFILGTREEQDIFFESIREITESDLNCKIIISMRDEYIAQLQGFEKIVPGLFEKRVRIGAISPDRIKDVITDTLAAAHISLENDNTAAKIIDRICDPSAGVQLPSLKVYLDRLRRDAIVAGTPDILTDALVEKAGTLSDVMAAFLADQSAAVGADLRRSHPGLADGAVQQLLEQLVTEEGTKLPLSRADLGARLPALEPVLDTMLAALQSHGILRRSDGIFELALDALVRRIADRRGAERTVRLKIENIVRQRLQVLADTRTYLSREELALVSPALPGLQLSGPEADFVKDSVRRLRRARRIRIGIIAAVIFTLSVFALFAWLARNQAVRAMALASSTANDLSFTIVDGLQQVPDSEDIRKSLLAKAEAVSTELERGGARSDTNAAFWRNILEGDIAKARDQMTVARREYAQAMTQAQGALNADAADTNARRNLSVALGRSAEIDLAENRKDNAAALYAQSLKMDSALAATNADNLEWQRDLAVTNLQIGMLEQQRGRPEAARPFLQRAATITDRLVAANRQNRDRRADQAKIYINLGQLEKDEGNLDLARAAHNKATAILAGLVRDDPRRLDWRRDLAVNWYRVAEISLLQSRWEPARQASTRALSEADALGEAGTGLEPSFATQRASIERLAGEYQEARRFNAQAAGAANLALKLDPADQGSLEQSAAAWREWSDIELAQCNAGAARVAAQRALGLARQLLGIDKDNLDYRINLYDTHTRIAVIEHRAGALKAARAAAAEAQRIAQRLQPRMPGLRKLQTDLDRLAALIEALDRGRPATQPDACRPG